MSDVPTTETGSCSLTGRTRSNKSNFNNGQDRLCSKSTKRTHGVKSIPSSFSFDRCIGSDNLGAPVVGRGKSLATGFTNRKKNPGVLWECTS